MRQRGLVLVVRGLLTQIRTGAEGAIAHAAEAIGWVGWFGPRVRAPAVTAVESSRTRGSTPPSRATSAWLSAERRVRSESTAAAWACACALVEPSSLMRGTMPCQDEIRTCAPY